MMVRELGDRSGIGRSLNNLGDLACHQGDYPKARGLFDEQLAITRELGDRLALAYSLEGLAAVIAGLGDYPRAVNIWGATERLREEVAAPLPESVRPIYDRRVEAARAGMGDDVSFDRAWQDGRAMSIEQAIALALDETVERP